MGVASGGGAVFARVDQQPVAGGLEQETGVSDVGDLHGVNMLPADLFLQEETEGTEGD